MTRVHFVTTVAPSTLPVEELPKIALDDARRAVAARQDDMHISLQFTRAPGITPQTFAQDVPGNALTAYYGNLTLGPHASADPSASVDRQTVLLNQAFTSHGHTVAAYGGCMAGAWIAGANVHEGAVAQGLSTNTWLFADPSYVGPGFIQHFQVHGLPSSVGAAAFVSGGNAVQPLEQQSGWVKLEQVRRRSSGLTLTGGASNGVIGGFVRLQVSRDSELILRRWVKPQRAGEIMRRQDDGFKSYLRNKAVALGLKEPEMAWPSLSEPSKMDMGDQVICTVNGSFTGGVAFVTGVVVTGLHYTRSGEFEIVVHRQKNADTDHKDQLTVIISPKKVTHGVAASVDFPLLGEFHLMASKSRVTRQGFTFDIDDPKAMAAYYKLLDGDLPGAGLVLESASWQEAESLSSHLQKEELPSGVKRLFAERAEIPKATSKGGGITLPRYIPGLKQPGLSIDRRIEESRHLIGDKSATVSTQSRSIEIEKQKFLRGVDTKRVAVHVRRISQAGQSSFARGVMLSATLTTTKLSSTNRNNIVNELNRKVFIDKAEGKFAPVSANASESYTVSLERLLTPEELQYLARVGEKGPLPKNASASLRALLTDLAKLGEDGVREPEKTLSAWQGFLRRTGLEGVGEVHRLIGDKNKLWFDAQSAAEATIAKRTLVLDVKYKSIDLSASTDPTELNERVQSVTDVLKKTRAAIQDAKNDPLRVYSPKNRAAQLEALRKHQMTLRALIDMRPIKPSQRPEIVGKLTLHNRKRLVKESVHD